MREHSAAPYVQENEAVRYGIILVTASEMVHSLKFLVQEPGRLGVWQMSNKAFVQTSCFFKDYDNFFNNKD